MSRQDDALSEAFPPLSSREHAELRSKFGEASLKHLEALCEAAGVDPPSFGDDRRLWDSLPKLIRCQREIADIHKEMVSTLNKAAKAAVTRKNRTIIKQAEELAALRERMESEITRDASKKVWSQDYAEEKVSEYWSKRKPKWHELVEAFFEGKPGAKMAFQDVFGPTAIARELGDGCYHTAVRKTRTYQKHIQPIFAPYPREPDGYDPPKRDTSEIDAFAAGALAKVKRRRK